MQIPTTKAKCKGFSDRCSLMEAGGDVERTLADKPNNPSVGEEAGKQTRGEAQAVVLLVWFQKHEAIHRQTRTASTEAVLSVLF